MHRKKQVKIDAIQVGQSSIPGNYFIRNLGFYIDDDLSLKPHIMHLSKSCYAQIRNIPHIRQVAVVVTGSCIVGAIHAVLFTVACIVVLSIL